MDVGKEGRDGALGLMGRKARAPGEVVVSDGL